MVREAAQFYPLAAMIAVLFRICGIVRHAHPALPGQRASFPIHGCEPSAFALCHRLASMMRTRHPLQVGLLPVFPEKAAFLGLLPFNNPNGNTASLGSDCQTLTQPACINSELTLQTHWVVNCSHTVC